MIGIGRATACSFGILAAVIVAAPQWAGATVLSGKVNADNEFWAYLSTDDSVQGTQIGTGNSWGTTYPFAAMLTPGVTNYLHVKALDGGPPAAFLGAFSLSDGQFVFVNGTDSLLTNTADWKVSVTGFGAGYSTPTFSGLNGVGPWYNQPEISQTAAWLWNDQGGNPSYFSTAINVVPEPAGLSVLALGGMGLLCRRRSCCR